MATLTNSLTADLSATLTSPLTQDGGGPPPVQNGFFGSQNTAGGGNWGFQQDRAMGNTYPLADTATLKTGFLWIISGSGSAPIKMGVYTDNAGVAGDLIAMSAPTTVNAAAQYFQFAFNDEVLTPGNYHIIAVSGPVTGAGYDMGSADSGGLPAAKIYNGTFSYASPPATAPAPDASYNNGLAVYITYTY